MKRIIGIVLAGLLFIVATQAAPVSPQEAKKVAERFVKLYNTGSSRSVGEVVTYDLANGKIAYYFVKLQPTGWVMVSGDDILKPVIGYAFDKQFVPMEQWGESARIWFDRLDEHIETTIEKPQLPVNDEWGEMFNDSYRKSTTGSAVDPFIEVNWNQSSGWNRFCPVDEEGPGGHAYVGCVAVAMAQAMSVYEYPVQPEGSYGYTHDEYGYLFVDFDKQAPYDWASMSKTSSGDENARLLYHLAVTVDMDFAPDGSGTYTRLTPNALKKYFGYSESVTYRSRSSFSDEQWTQMLIDELEQGRPLIYSGNGNDNQAGHAFNLDGVSADGRYFHVNWGWSGSMNGYFTLDDMNPGSSNFSFGQAAVFGIKPPSAGPYDITLSETSVYDQQPEGTFVAKVSVADEEEDNVYTYDLKGRFNVFIDDYGPANFFIENDSLKTSKVFDADKYATEPLIIEVTDTLGNFFRKEFTIDIEKFYFGPTALSLSDTSVEEGKSSGYFVGVIEVEDDITSNEYDFSCKGGYSQDVLADDDCFFIRNDSLFTARTFYLSDGEVYYVEITVNDVHNNQLKELVEIRITENISGGTSATNISLESFRIYPNPVNSFVTFEFAEVDNSFANIDIYNMSGQRILQFNVEAGVAVDVSTLQEGVYLAVIRTGKNSAYRKMVISK
jgi:hypothetical protein